MKKTIKTLMAFLTAMTMTITTMGTIAFADETETTVVSEDQKESKMYKYSELKELSEEELDELTEKIVHIETFKELEDALADEIFGIDNNPGITKRSINIEFYIGKSDYANYVEGETEKLVEEYLNDDKHHEIVHTTHWYTKAGILNVSYNNTYVRNDRTVDRTLTTDEASLKSEDIWHDITLSFLCLKQIAFGFMPVSPFALGTGENAEETTPAVTSTLKGDVDLDGEVGLSDITALSKNNLSNELYPLINETAYANADMNGDGVVDGLDTSALIELNLGMEC